MAHISLPKYLQIAQQLEADIQAGRWETGKLPSVRDIAGEHGVSAVTASRALQILRDKHLVNTFDRSGCYLIPPAQRQGDHWALCLRLPPGPMAQAAASLTRKGFELVAGQQGLTLDTTALAGPNRELSEREWHRLVRSARSTGVQGLFLLPSRQGEAGARQDELFLQACRTQGIPVVLIERALFGPDRPLEHDLVCTDDAGGGALCTRHLLDQGRRRISFVTGPPTSSHNDRIAGYLYALYRFSPPGHAFQPFVLQQPTDLLGRRGFQVLVDQLLELRVDGVVCYQDDAAFGLIRELLARGRRIPEEVALTGFDDLPASSTLPIRVTTYAYPAEDLARQAFRVMRQRIQSPLDPPIKVVVPGKLLIRESSVAGSSTPPGPSGS